MRIGIDLMGGDSPPENFYPAILSSLKQLKSDTVLVVLATKLVANEISSFLEKNLSLQIATSQFTPPIEYKIVSEVIQMDDNPLFAIRKKTDSSLVVGMRLLKEKYLDALLACGNTGAMIGLSALYLSSLKDISRPALLIQLPTKKNPLVVLDVGGLVLCKSENLISFAKLGTAFYQAIYGIQKPKVGLLNIGLESKKGSVELRSAFEQLKNDAHQNREMDFVGNIEGRDIFNGSIDVLVTDGFTGNVLLKTAEGVANFIFETLDQTLVNQKSDINDLLKSEFLASFEGLKKQFDYREYGGAIVCGVDGLVIKAHGNASEKTLLSSILSAESLVSKNLVELIKEKL